MRNKIFRNVTFPLIERITDNSIRQKLEFLNKSQFWEKEKIEEYQNKKLREIILHAYEYVPYYRHIFKSLKIKPESIKTKEDLKRLPVLTKAIINSNKETLRAVNFKEKSYPKLTSGSTGEPTRFYQTKDDFSWIWAGHFRAWNWGGYVPGDRYAKISINNDRNKMKKKLQDSVFRCLYIYIYNMSQKQIKKYVDEIIKFKPILIYGYSSSLNAIADYMAENDILYKAKAVITTGDNLRVSYRKVIEERFQCKVYDEFGCGGEGLYIAAQCENMSYHVNDELMIIEVENGEIIVTSLNNYAMPLIRYKTDDFVTLGKKCSCGRNLTTIRSLDGRTHEVVKTRNGTRLNSPFFEALFESLNTVSQFKIIQENLDGIRILIKRNKYYIEERDETKIIKYITKPLGFDFKIEFEYVDDFQSNKVGKFKSIESRII